jgi:Outer membrane protein beta-barrel domain
MTGNGIAAAWFCLLSLRNSTLKGRKVGIGVLLFFAVASQSLGQISPDSTKIPKISNIPPNICEGIAVARIYSPKIVLGINGMLTLENLSANGALFENPFQSRLSYGFGLTFTQTIGKKRHQLFIQAGYSSKGMRMVADSTLFLDSMNAAGATTQIKGHYLMLRPGISFSIFAAGRSRFFLSLFPSVGISLGNTIVTRFNGAKATGNSNLFNPLFLGGGLQLKWQYQLPRKLAFACGPFVELQANRTFETNLYEPKLYTLGFDLQFHFGL